MKSIRIFTDGLLIGLTLVALDRIVNPQTTTNPLAYGIFVVFNLGFLIFSCFTTSKLLYLLAIGIDAVFMFYCLIDYPLIAGPSLLPGVTTGILTAIAIGVLVIYYTILQYQSHSNNRSPQ